LKPLIDPSIYDKFILCDNASDYQFPSLENWFKNTVIIIV
jgi:hypothetical protein